MGIYENWCPYCRKQGAYFLLDHPITELFPEVLTRYDAIIDKDEPIHVGFSDVQTQQRFWKIEGFAEVPCGGTHVKSTGEVGYVTLRRKNIGGGKERIEIRLVEEG